MIRDKGCPTCKHATCRGHCKGWEDEADCPQYCGTYLEMRLDGPHGCDTCCKCLSVDHDEECQYYEEVTAYAEET